MAGGKDHPLMEIPRAEHRMRRDGLLECQAIAVSNDLDHVLSNLFELHPRLLGRHATLRFRGSIRLPSLIAVGKLRDLFRIEPAPRR
jgi:hypothetical protein